MGAQHCPLGLHALWGLRAAGVVGGRPRGGGLPPFCGASGVRRCPSPDRPSSGAGSRGSATRVCHVRSVRAWGPSTGPTACALAGRRCSLWGWRRGVPGEGAFHHCEGRLRSGAVPPPTARPLGGLLGSAAHVLWARVCGCGGPILSPWPACRWGGGGLSPGGVACHRCDGRLVSGAVPPPAARPLERAAGAPRPVCRGCGRCGRGDPAAAPQRARLRARVARCGGGGRAFPGGVPFTIVRGSGVRRCPSPGCPSSGAGSRGSATRGSRVQSVQAWGPSTSPTAGALVGRRCSLWAGGRASPGGGAFHHCEGRLRSGAVPPPAARSLGGLLGSATHVL